MTAARRLQLAAKHAADRVVAGAALAALSPALLAVAAAIRLDDAGPVFFRQDRAGEGGRTFRVFKFRTMVVDAEGKGLRHSVSRGDDRITRVGRFLRDWSLDEIPQLLNVLRGEMSLVGPRPTLLGQVARYGPFERRRLDVRPGLTGWAQVNGRNTISWERRIELDVWYVDHFSLLLDLRILVRTPGVILRREGLFGASGTNVDFLGSDGKGAAPAAGDGTTAA